VSGYIPASFKTVTVTDHGYMLYRADYRQIDPRYGTLEDWDKLLKGVHERGMKLMCVLFSF
jgi:glycosidase